MNLWKHRLLEFVRYYLHIRFGCPDCWSRNIDCISVTSSREGVTREYVCKDCSCRYIRLHSYYQ